MLVVNEMSEITAQLSTLTTEEWKAEQQLERRTGVHTSSCQEHAACLRSSRAEASGDESANSQVQHAQQLGLDRDSSSDHVHKSHLARWGLGEPKDISQWMASLILAQDKRWRRA
jgi:hypothetical protein